MANLRDPSPPAATVTTHGAAPVVASLIGVAPDGTVHVEVPEHGQAAARLLSSVSRSELRRASPGRQVLVLFEQGDPARPIVVGLLEAPLEDMMASAEQEEPKDKVFTAEGSITLVCGDASLTLHADGRVVTRGVNVVSVASEQQRIQGAVVRIN